MLWSVTLCGDVSVEARGSAITVKQSADQCLLLAIKQPRKCATAWTGFGSPPFPSRLDATPSALVAQYDPVRPGSPHQTRVLSAESAMQVPANDIQLTFVGVYALLPPG